MKHDTDQLSALVDGELDHETRDQLLGHLAHCSDCRRVVEAERKLKAMLRGLSDPGPELAVPAPVEQLVTAMTPPAPTPAKSRWLGPGPMLATEPRPPAIPVASATPESDRRSSRRARYAVGLVGATGAFFGAAFAMGGESTDSPDPRVVPPVQQYSVDHARMTSGVPLSDPAGVPASLTDSAFAQYAGR